MRVDLGVEPGDPPYRREIREDAGRVNIWQRRMRNPGATV